MAPKQKRIVVPLSDTAVEGLAALAELTGLGEDALAKRLLAAILNVIAGAIAEADSPGDLEAPEFRPAEAEVPGIWR